MVKLDIDDDGSVNPVRYDSLYEDWINGTSMAILADESNLTMKEIEHALRQASIEEVAAAGKKNSKGRKKN